jgi:hypothetical protein
MIWIFLLVGSVLKEEEEMEGIREFGLLSIGWMEIIFYG